MGLEQIVQLGLVDLGVLSMKIEYASMLSWVPFCSTMSVSGVSRPVAKPESPVCTQWSVHSACGMSVHVTTTGPPRTPSTPCWSGRCLARTR